MKKINIYILDECDKIIRDYQKELIEVENKKVNKDEALNNIILEFKRIRILINKK